MIRDTAIMLAQEPWCFTPEQIARLTDWQVISLYAKPAFERAKRNNPGAAPGRQATRPHGEGVSTGPPGEPGSPEHRNACVDAYENIQGLSHEQAVAQYERQLRIWERDYKGKT